LQKLRRKKFALKFDSFFNESPRGDGLSICSFEKGARWSGFGIEGTILSVTPVPTKYEYLSRVNSSVRKMSPAFAKKSMVEPGRVRRLFSFPAKYRVKYT
jgi:hypothetical protein